MITLFTNFGQIKIETFADKAPATVANFEQYVKDGFYDGTIFHSVGVSPFETGLALIAGFRSAVWHEHGCHLTS